MFRRYNRWQSRFDQPDPYEGSYDVTDPTARINMTIWAWLVISHSGAEARAHVALMRGDE